MQEDELDPVRTEADFGLRVKEQRKQKKWTQKKLAELIGIDASAISRIEQGVRAVRLGEAAQIAQALGTDLDELVFGGEVPPEVVLQRSRDVANRTMHEIRYAAVEMADSYLDIAELLAEHPGLFAALSYGEENEKNLPKTIPDYFNWVERRIRAVYPPEHHVRSYTSDQQTADRVQSLIAAITENIVSTVPLPDDDDEGQPDEPEA